MQKKERIRQAIPYIDQIKDERLREQVLQVWVRAWEETCWKDIADVPFDLHVAGCSLVEHTNFVVSSAIAMASIARNIWQLEVDTDVLLAGAVLHDVSKVVEQQPEEGKLGKKSPIGENMVHGAYGTHLALDAGLPLSVVHIINCHTPQVSMVPKTLEGILLSHADHAAADLFFLQAGKPLVLDMLDMKFYR